MAVYLTPNTQFKPFSYQEMLAPVLAYKEAYDDADEELNTLMEDAATKAFNFGPQDVAEKEAYDNIMSKLKQASDSLVSGNVNAFKDIRNLNKEYRKTMIPINQKIAKRAELTKEQRLLQKANPYIRFDKDYSTESLEGITDASTYNTYDLSTIYTNTAKDTASLIAGLHRDQVGTPTKIKGTDSYSVVSGYGFTPDEWDEDMQNTDSALYKYVQTAKEKATKGVTNPFIKAEIEAGVEETIRNNIGKFETKLVKAGSSDSSGSRGPNTSIGDPINTDEEGNEYYVLGTNMWKKSSKGIWNRVATEDTPDNPDNPGGGKDAGKIVLKQNQRLLGPSVFKEINANNHYTKFKDFKKEMSGKFKNRAKSQFKINEMPVSGVLIKYDDFEPTHPMARWMLNYAGSEEAIYEYTFYYNLDTGDVFATQGKQVKPVKKANTSGGSGTPQTPNNEPPQTPNGGGTPGNEPPKDDEDLKDQY